MFRMLAIASLCLLTGASTAPAGWAAAPAQQVVDRIVARIGNDILTLSEMRELAGYQQLVDGQAQPEDRLLSELIEQWALNDEATAAQFPAAAASEVDREAARIESRFPNARAYDQRLAALAMTRESVRRLVARQIFLARYVDYKFRPAVQVDEAAIETYYQQEILPALATKKQAPPPLEGVRDQIRELLVQQGISERATTWFEETKSRLSIAIIPASNAAPVSPSHE